MLKKNTLLTEVMEKMRTTSDQDATSACRKLECDFCIGEKHTADKFCLQCLASYCELHLQTHYESPVFMKHKLIPAAAQLQTNICSDHGKLLDIYCCYDQQCICYMCMVESHMGHKSSSVESVRIKNQDALEKKRIECLQMIAQREEGQIELTKAVTSIKSFAQAAEKNNEEILTELIYSLKRRYSEVKSLIEAQEKAELSQAEELHQRLDGELKELRARIPEIQQVLSTNDHIDFMRKYTSLCDLSMFKDLPTITGVSPGTSDVFSVSRVKEHLEKICQQEVARISKQVMHIHVVEPSEPETREDFLQYFCDLHVDRNTISNKLWLSEDDKKVTYSYSAHCYPDHPERFEFFPYFLCKESLYGRCYWEVECSGNDLAVAVSYKSIKRNGHSDQCRIDYDAKSWRLCPSKQRTFFRHNQMEVKIPPFCRKTIGVYLNLRMGTLSFYNVSNQMDLLQKVQATFTEPLHAGFWVGSNSVVHIR